MMISIIAATGCASTEDPSKIVAKITSDIEKSEEMNISLKTFNKEYKMYLNKYGVDDTNEQYAQMCEELKNNIIVFLIQEQWLLRAGVENGITVESLTESDHSKIEENFQTAMQTYYDFYAETAKTALGTGYTEEQLLEKEKELTKELFAKSGVTEDDVLVWERNEYLENLVMEALLAEVTATDEEIAAAYTKCETDAKTAYETDVYSYESSSYYPYFYMPEGTRLVKQVLIAFDSETLSSIQTFRKNSDDASAVKLRDEKLPALLEEAQKVLDLAKSGEDFDGLVTTYSDDTGKTSYPDGYTVIPKSVGYPTELVSAAYALEKVGDITTELVACDYGYLILKYAGDYTLTAEDKEDAQTYAKTTAENANKTAFAENIVSEWEKNFAYTIDYDYLKVSKEYQTYPDGTAAGAAKTEQSE